MQCRFRRGYNDVHIFYSQKNPNIAFAYVSLLKLKKGNSEMQNDKWVTLLIFFWGGGVAYISILKKIQFQYDYYDDYRE